MNNEAPLSRRLGDGGTSLDAGQQLHRRKESACTTKWLPSMHRIAKPDALLEPKALVNHLGRHRLLRGCELGQRHARHGRC